jgi:hypothetical protein
MRGISPAHASRTTHQAPLLLRNGRARHELAPARDREDRKNQHVGHVTLRRTKRHCRSARRRASCPSPPRMASQSGNHVIMADPALPSTRRPASIKTRTLGDRLRWLGYSACASVVSISPEEDDSFNLIRQAWRSPFGFHCNARLTRQEPRPASGSDQHQPVYAGSPRRVRPRRSREQHR